MSSSLSFIRSSCLRRRLIVATGGNGSNAAAPLIPLQSSIGDGIRCKIQQQERCFQTSSNLATKLGIFSSRFSVINKRVGLNILSWERNYVQQKSDPMNHMELLSTQAEPATASVLNDGVQAHVEPTMIQPSIVQSPDGRQFAAFELPTFQRKLKPYIVKRRLARMKTFVGKQKNIRHSPWRMNLVCQFAAGQTLTDAIQQLEFCRKSMAPLVKKVLIRTSNVADMKYGLQQSQLEVAECFATKGSPLKRMRVMGRGRTGRMEHKHSHFRVVLREIDFKLRMYLAPTIGQKKRWFLRQQQAEAEFAKAKAERDEISRLEKETEAYRNKETK